MAGRTAHPHNRCALECALSLGPEQVIARLRESGLRSKGGAPGLVADRWQRCRDAAGAAVGPSFAVCSAVDGLSGLPVGQLLLTQDPWSVLEGLAIGAYVVGAQQAYVCLEGDRTEGRSLSPGSTAAPGLLSVVAGALADLREAGESVREVAGGASTAGTASVPNIHVWQVRRSLAARDAGALLAALEGRQALPDVRYADPLVRGLNGRPTLIESAETFASVAAVFRAMASCESAEVSRPAVTRFVAVRAYQEAASTTACTEGLKEVVLGSSLAAVITEVISCGPEDLGVEVVQVGGICGPFFDRKQLDMPFTTAFLEQATGAVGGAMLELFTGKPCGVTRAREAVARLNRESCGKCAACWEGTRQLLGLLDEAIAGQAEPGHMESALLLCRHLKTAALCDVGRLAPVPFLSCRELYLEDFAAHFERGCCAAGEER